MVGSRISRLVGATLVCACLGNVLAEMLRSLRDAYNTDFLSSFYAAADMLRRGNDAIYCSSCLQSHAEQLFHTGAAVFSFQYDNPPLGAWLLVPLTYLTPQTALGIFLLASLVAVGAAAWLMRREITRDPRRMLIGVLAFASLPAAMTFAYGQWDGLLALAAAGAYLALRQREPASAPPVTTTTTPVATMAVKAYFLRDNALVPVVVDVPQSRAVARAALEALLAGPPAGYTTAVPEAAKLGNVTLVGFLRDDRANVYTGTERVRSPSH